MLIETGLHQGILISGPPGTGKTLLARAIARDSGLPFVFASGAEFVESSTADGAEKVFNLFFTARANACEFFFYFIICFDCAINLVAHGYLWLAFDAFRLLLSYLLMK